MAASTPYTDEWVVGPQKTKFFVRTQAPAEYKAAVVFVHGFIEHLGRYDFVRERLTANNLAVLFYDQRGFGRTALDTKERSPGASYGKNTRAEMLADVEFMLNFAKDRFKTENLFLYGHSMGGCIALQYGCVGPDSLNVKGNLRGIIATSPLLRQATSAPKWQLTIGHAIQFISPWMMIPATVNASQITHDKAIQTAYLEDPFVVQEGTLRGIDTMLRGGADTVEKHFRHWPESLPVILFHGSDDKVTLCTATEKFHDDIKASDKAFHLVKGAYHEIHNEPDFKEKLLEDINAWLTKRIGNLPESSKKADTSTGVAEEPATVEGEGGTAATGPKL